MSIPASLAVSKLRYPETETSLTAGTTVVPEDNDDEKPANALHAIANGAWLGLRIAGMVVTTVLCIVAFIAFVDGLLSWYFVRHSRNSNQVANSFRWGHYWGIPNLTLELILGYICYPIGESPPDSLANMSYRFTLRVSFPPRSLARWRSPESGATHWGQNHRVSPSTPAHTQSAKWPNIRNEFVAYSNLQHDPQYADLSPRSRYVSSRANSTHCVWC